MLLYKKEKDKYGSCLKHLKIQKGSQTLNTTDVSASVLKCRAPCSMESRSETHLVWARVKKYFPDMVQCKLTPEEISWAMEKGRISVFQAEGIACLKVQNQVFKKLFSEERPECLEKRG